MRTMLTLILSSLLLTKFSLFTRYENYVDANPLLSVPHDCLLAGMSEVSEVQLWQPQWYDEESDAAKPE